VAFFIAGRIDDPPYVFGSLSSQQFWEKLYASFRSVSGSWSELEAHGIAL